MTTATDELEPMAKPGGWCGTCGRMFERYGWESATATQCDPCHVAETGISIWDRAE